MITHVDQASGLRAMAKSRPSPATVVQVVAVSSGKGGVGKTNIVANLAVAAAQQGRHVLVMDADLALGNVDVLLGLTPTVTLEEVLTGHRQLEEVIVEGPAGIRILPATNGVQDLTALTPEQQLRLQDGFLTLSVQPDLLLIDCAAGISSNVLYFSLVAHDVLVVISPEPTSLTDAYALVKVLSTRYRQKRFRILINMAKSAREAKDVYRKLSRVTDRFLTVSLDFVGWVPFDEYVPMAVCQQRAVVEAFPKAPSSRALAGLITQLTRWRHEQPLNGGVQLFGPLVMWNSAEEGAEGS
ncbi:MAG: MinD/ParA family protein [Nitrospirae bacterium]|nr:MAG: MinD/ParA family protein [Nitrospirota bacterium]